MENKLFNQKKSNFFAKKFPEKFRENLIRDAFFFKES